MSMNTFLSEYYSTNQPLEEKTASAGELSPDEKVEMFAKLANENGIDLSQLPDERLEQLFNETFAKQAGEMPPQFQKKDGDGDGKVNDGKPSEKKEDKDERKEAAEREFQEKQAAQAEFERADFMGRTMAHAYVNEMRKIASNAEAASTQAPAQQPAAEKTASMRDRLLKLASDEKKDGDGDGKVNDGKKDEKKSAPPWMKDKEASALDELAAETAVQIVQHYNKEAAAQGLPQYDVKVAAERVAAVHTLGMGESTKVASAQNVEQAAYIRALEFLSAAGYPVNE